MIRSFRSLFDKAGSRVVIPIVQRDYAQGRREEVRVRERFLDDLRQALEQNESLHLDFVYGYVPTETAEDEGLSILPLDGQQRLTTLFLLHWYLAVRDGALEDFRSYAVGVDRSRFTYEVRDTSRDFFDALPKATIDLDELLDPDEGAGNALSKTLRDQPWFFLVWNRDPTVCACLVMLDAIHERFAATRGLYARLVDPDRPGVTFEFLRLRDFGLGDELYIKMNARGKPLTAFEAFKAQLEKHLRDELTQLDHHRIAQGLDGAWCDFIWGVRDDVPFDRRMMNVMRSVALVAFPREGKGEAIDRINDTLEAIYKDALESFDDYLQAGLVSESFVEHLIGLLDDWAGVSDRRVTLARSDYYDERELLGRILEGRTRGEGSVTYTDWVRYVAFCTYALHRDSEGFDEWMRVISNLACNTALENADAMRTSLVGMDRLLASLAGDRPLLDVLADPQSEVVGFARQQIREERLKAQLMVRHSEWRPLIEKAETHPYFEGQIEFLFEFCGVLERWLPEERCTWDDAEDEGLRAAFVEWRTRAFAVFPPSGEGLRKDLPKGEFLWERALLCEGNYLLKKGMNWSLLGEVDRDVSWKRLLRADMSDAERQAKRSIVERVLRRIDVDDVAGSLRAIIGEGVRPDGEGSEVWRRRLVMHPEMLAYCQRRWLRWEDGRLLLLRGLRKASYEGVFTWFLRDEIEAAREANRMVAFESPQMAEVWGHGTTPHLILRVQGRPAEYRVTFDGKDFEVAPAPGEEEVVLKAAPDDVLDALEEWGAGMSEGAGG